MSTTTSPRPNHREYIALHKLAEGESFEYRVGGPATLRSIQTKGWTVRVHGNLRLTAEGCDAIRVSHRFAAQPAFTFPTNY